MKLLERFPEKAQITFTGKELNDYLDLHTEKILKSNCAFAFERHYSPYAMKSTDIFILSNESKDSSIKDELLKNEKTITVLNNELRELDSKFKKYESGNKIKRFFKRLFK
jgi:hypothetical protein